MSDYKDSITITGNSGSSAGFTGLGRMHPDIQRIDIQVSGVFSSATVKLQTSFDGGTTWSDVLADKDANIVSLTAAGIMTVKPRYSFLRLSWSGGAGAVALTAVVF